MTTDDAKSRDPRQDRLAAALRENLKRRKAQAKARAATPASVDDRAADADPQATSSDDA